MIKSDFGTIEVQGNKVLIMSEVSSLMQGLIEKEILTREELEKSVEIGLKTKEEISKVSKEILEGSLSSMVDVHKLIADLVKARKSGLTKKVKPKTIFEDKNMKVTEIEINAKGKTKEQINEELKNALDEAFKK